MGVVYIGVFSILLIVIFIIPVNLFLYPKIQKEVENIENAEYEKNLEN